MGKLADLVSEDLSFAERIKINVRKVGLAGVGLASIVDTERSRLYRQVMEMGEPHGDSDSVVGRISKLGTGTVNLVLEESQRVFDELVEEGEQALNRSKEPALAPPVQRKITNSRPVAKNRAPDSPMLKSAYEKNSQAASKAALAPKKNTKAEPVQERLSVEMKQRLEQAASRAASVQADKQQKLELTALVRQIQEGDVKGRRPAKSKPDAQAEFDARRPLKGMKAEEALRRLETLLQRLATETMA